MGSTVTITKKTDGRIPRLPFLHIKNAILGSKYDLSIAFVSSRESKRLNTTYRGKDKPTNVLSFPLSKDSGEIILDMKVAQKEAPLFGMTQKKFLCFLVIHGMLHLKGLDHGSTMEREEKKFLKKFS